jgi:hypothetical protein
MMSARRVCLALIILAWVFTGVALVRGGPNVSGIVFVLVAAPLLALGTLGFLILVILAVGTGRKRIRSVPLRAGEPVSFGYRVGWGVGAVLMTPLLSPALLVIALLSGPAGSGVRTQDLIPGELDPALAVLGIGFLGLLGLLLTTAEPPGHGLPLTDVSGPTAVDADYAARLAARKARTAELARDAEHQAVLQRDDRAVAESPASATSVDAPTSTSPAPAKPRPELYRPPSPVCSICGTTLVGRQISAGLCKGCQART